VSGERTDPTVVRRERTDPAVSSGARTEALDVWGRPGPAVVRVRGLVKRFGDRRVLDGLDLTVRRGEFVALLGRSGSGKSTLLRVLAGTDADIGGECRVAGRVSMAFQQPRLLPWRRVWRTIALGLRVERPREVAVRALTEVHLADRADAWPGTLSGGEAQRVSLARALVREPDLLLLDEPFGSLDALTRRSMHRLVGELWRRHRPGVLLVTHDVDEALALADRVLVLAGGRIAAEHVVTSRPGAGRPRETTELAGLRARVLSDLGVSDDEAA
jgi:sulfonate transport system ATP-binding protein